MGCFCLKEKAKSQIEERICDSQATVFNEEQQIITQDAADYSSTVNFVEPLIEKTVGVDDVKNKELLNNTQNLEDDVSPSVSEDSRTSQMGRPLLKSKLNIDHEVLQPKIRRKTWSLQEPKTQNTIESIDQKKSAPRSLYTLMKSGSVKEPCKLNTLVVRKTESTKLGPSAHSTPKRSATPMKTPSKVTNVANKQQLAIPSVKQRMETPVHPSAAGSKTPGQKWPFFSDV
ncbi:uncharacterized protein LOC143622742 [Bidens hawaiensis]|uniref:uncharacterized protein LOC143622742 n=1 Tax=Bidens hawaiensis TaxID=980011 RepID=UPI00404B41A1